jgi:hypothetical protein
VPTVTLTDVAGNSVTYTINAVVLGDVTAPTGSVSVSPSSAWATLDHVVATPGGLSDDVSPTADIKVSVDWGDGTSTDSTGSAAVNHVYTVAGTYDVVPTITDEAGNPTTLSGHSVTVSADKVAPLVKLLLPKRHRHSVKVWKLLRGKATDTNGTGVRRVHVRAVEKRGTKWFGYRPGTKTWARAATKAAAFKKARVFSLITNARHRWSATLVGLRKGTLVYKVSAVDRVRNLSGVVSHKATLTKP